MTDTHEISVETGTGEISQEWMRCHIQHTTTPNRLIAKFLRKSRRCDYHYRTHLHGIRGGSTGQETSLEKNCST